MSENQNSELRSCRRCVKNQVCFAYREIFRAIHEIPTNAVAGVLPGVRDGVFEAVANCCLLFRLQVLATPGKMPQAPPE